MKILILDIYYDPFLKNFYKKSQAARDSPYNKTLELLMLECFGTADYYSKNLKLLGHEAKDIIINDKRLQKKWAREHGNMRWLDWADNAHFPFSKHYFRSHWQEEILKNQIRQFRPDVLYCQSLGVPGSRFINDLKKEFPVFVVGQIASSTNFDKDFLSAYDLILTSFPHFVSRFRSLGIKSEYFRIGFESSVLKKLHKTQKQYDVSFIGSFSRHHQNDAVFEAATDVWGYGRVPESEKYHGEAWGIDMYNILYNSKIALNRHINVAEDHANNMRLFEATGVGTMLITDAKSDLKKLFVPGKEVETYSSAPELLDKVKYYLANPRHREQIAKAGQKRTLKDHTYKSRIQELLSIINKYI